MRRLAAVLSVTAIASPAVALAVLVAFPAADRMIMDRQLHFWAVGATALAAAAACGVLVAAARSLRETRLLFLALAFMTIGAVFSVHGLMTPGIVFDHFHAPVAVSGWTSIAAGAVFVALSAMEMPRRLDALVRRFGVAIFAWTAIAGAAFIVASFAAPGWLDWAPTDRRSVQYVVAIGSTVLLAFATLRYVQAYRFANLPSQAAMVGALVLLAQVPAILLWGRTWQASWWSYHAVYGAAFAVLFAGWAIEIRRAGSLKAIADALSMRDALAQLNRGHGAHVLELVDAIEAKDVAMLGHVRRVSAYALGIGRRLGLSPTELRSLALAAEMHDVGKIGVPDAILAKPGPLTAEETAEMRKHTGRGFEIAVQVPAIRDLAPIIRAHHERYNGAGYPDGLAGDAIPLLARIIAVADTYDAMTSARPYRPAMTPDAAIAEMRRVRGSELDPRCVDVFLAWIEESPELLAA